MTTEGPKANSEVAAAVESYEALKANFDSAKTYEISDEFLKSFAESDDPAHQDLYTEFIMLGEGSPENVDEVLNGIDELLTQFQGDSNLDGLPDDPYHEKSSSHEYQGDKLVMVGDAERIDITSNLPDAETLMASLKEWAANNPNDSRFDYHSDKPTLSDSKVNIIFTRGDDGSLHLDLLGYDPANTNFEKPIDEKSKAAYEQLQDDVKDHLPANSSYEVAQDLGGRRVSAVIQPEDVAEFLGVESEEAASQDDSSSETSDGGVTVEVPVYNEETGKVEIQKQNVAPGKVREVFQNNIQNFADWNEETGEMTIKNMDAAVTQVSRIHDFIGPNGGIKKIENPEEYKLTSNDKTYTWNADLKSWIVEGGTTLGDRLKVFNNTTIKVEKLEESEPTDEPAPAAPTEEVVPTVEPAAPVEDSAEATPAEETQVEAPAAPVKPSEEEEATKLKQVDQLKGFTEELLAVKGQVDELMALYQKVQAMDARDADGGDRYEAKAKELGAQYVEAVVRISNLEADLTALKESGLYSEDDPRIKLREDQISEMIKNTDTILEWVERELNDDPEASTSFSRLRQRDERLDTEWKNEVMPRINGVVEGVDEHMSVNVAKSRGARKNNKDLEIVYTDGDTVQTHPKKISITFNQVLIDDTYDRSDDITIKYKGDFYTSIDAAVKRAAEDFKEDLPKTSTEEPDEGAPNEPNEPTEPTETVGAQDETPDEQVPDAPDEATEVTPEGAEIKKLRWMKRQRVFDDIANLQVSKTEAGRTVPLPDGWTGVTHSETSGHNYTQKVEGGYVTQRLVQLNGEGNWYEVPFVPHIEEGLASKYQAIEDSNGEEGVVINGEKVTDWHAYSPDKGSDAWQNRYKIGALTLKEYKGERPQ